MGFLSNLFKKDYCTDKSSEYYGYPNDLKEWEEINKKYEDVINTHYKLLERIRMNYTIVNNLGDVFSPQMDSVIRDCEKDIAIAQEFYNYCKEEANHYKGQLDDYIPIYESFKRLAIIYEKRKEYQKALDICQKAIDIGFYKDGTPGQIPGRMARLYKKLNNLG